MVGLYLVVIYGLGWIFVKRKLFGLSEVCGELWEEVINYIDYIRDGFF